VRHLLDVDDVADVDVARLLAVDSDIRDGLAAEPVLAGRHAVGLLDRLCLLGNLHREIEHGSLSRRDVGLAVVARATSIM